MSKYQVLNLSKAAQPWPACNSPSTSTMAREPDVEVEASSMDRGGYDIQIAQTYNISILHIYKTLNIQRRWYDKHAFDGATQQTVCPCDGHMGKRRQVKQ